MTEADIIWKPSKSMDWFLYDISLRHERVKGLSLKQIKQFFLERKRRF